ncbi:ABC-type amino acid transport system permease subunit [Salibacterium salarium]|uniref:hypothetical protein n=1 Tax=Salibacterium salarium TaxID=284579 RepID=UPI002787F0C4|nr:hypothetical protein [Salibacterium salarium]MDQ0300535.1 ABC-type amino acid transport system permease subunit [Salibacterium salarium]
MNKTRTGLSFLLMATILYATRFIAGAIGGIGATSWNDKEFARAMSFIPNSLMVVTIIALALGIVFFAWGVYEALNKK